VKRRELFTAAICLAVAPAPIPVALPWYEFVREQLRGFHMWAARADHLALSGLISDDHPQYRLVRR
jgi:hypothetical protein